MTSVSGRCKRYSFVAHWSRAAMGTFRFHERREEIRRSRLPSPQRGEGLGSSSEKHLPFSSFHFQNFPLLCSPSRIWLPSPQRGEGLGVRGIAVLSQRAFVFPHLERFFSLSWNSMRHASPPSPLAPLPRWGEGNRDRLIFSHLLRHYQSRAGRPACPFVLMFFRQAGRTALLR